MEGLSEGIGTGYAQVLGEGYDNLKNVIAWQERAMELEAKKKEAAQKQKQETGKELATKMAKLPTDLYEKHNPEFEDRKKNFLDYTYQNVDKLEMGTPERMEWERQANDLMVFANQSKNFREQLEAVEKQRTKLSPESLEYLDAVKTGVDAEGKPILSMDQQRLYFNPDYSKVYAHSGVRELEKARKSSVAGSPAATNVPGVYRAVNTETEEVTQDQLNQAAQFGWDNMNEAEKQNAMRAFIFDFNKGGAETKPYESLVKTIKDENGNDVVDYSEATEAYVKDKYLKNKKPYQVIRRKPQFVYDQSYRGGRGQDEPKITTAVVVEEENRNVISSIQEGGMKGKQWYNATDAKGKTVKWLKDPNTDQYYKPASDGKWEPVKDTEVDEHILDPIVVSGERRKEIIEYRDRNLESRQERWVVPYVMEQDGSVTDTRLNQGVIGTPREAKIAWVTKDGKQFDSRPETGDAELKFIITISTAKGKLKSFPATEKHIKLLEEKYEGIDLMLWDEYQRMLAQGQKKPSSSKPAQSKPAATSTKTNQSRKQKADQGLKDF